MTGTALKAFPIGEVTRALINRAREGKKMSDGVGVLQIVKEALAIQFQGPAIITEGTFKTLHEGRGYGE